MLIGKIEVTKKTLLLLHLFEPEGTILLYLRLLLNPTPFGFFRSCKWKLPICFRF